MEMNQDTLEKMLGMNLKGIMPLKQVWKHIGQRV